MVMEALAVIAVFAYLAGVFMLRYVIGEKVFWGNRYLRQGYKILLSRRADAYLVDTAALCPVSLLAFLLYFYGRSAIAGIGQMATGGMLACSALLFLCARLLEKTCVFYHEQGLLVATPFQPLRAVPWNEIGSIRKSHAAAQRCHVLDQNGRRLAWFPLTRKTQPFFDLAQKNSVSVCMSKGDKMILNTSGKKLNGTLGAWEPVLARSAYARNDVIGFVPFQDLAVVLFMDRHLHMDNVIALSLDGNIRWKVSDIIKQPGPVSYISLTQENETTVSIMAVVGRRYDGVIYEVDVYEQRIVSQRPRIDAGL